MRAVLDTSWLVAALHSPAGASRQLLEEVLAGRIKPLLSVPLVLEYEAVLTRPEHLVASGWAKDEAVALVKAFCKMGEPVHLAYSLRPQVPDPDDEFVLETAFHGKPDVMITFNRKDFETAAGKLRIRAISPQEAAREWRRA